MLSKFFTWLAQAPERFKRYSLGTSSVYIPEEKLKEIKTASRTHHDLAVDLNDYYDHCGNVERASYKVLHRLYYATATLIGLVLLGKTNNENIQLVQQLINDQQTIRTLCYIFIALQCVDLVSNSKRLRVATADAQQETDELNQRYEQAKHEPSIDEKVQIELDKHKTQVMGTFETALLQQASLLKQLQEEVKRSSQRLKTYEEKETSKRLEQTVIKYSLPNQELPNLVNSSYDIPLLALLLSETNKTIEHSLVPSSNSDIDDCFNYNQEYIIENITSPDETYNEINEIHEVFIDSDDYLHAVKLTAVNSEILPKIRYSPRAPVIKNATSTKGPFKKHSAPRKIHSTGRYTILKKKFIHH